VANFEKDYEELRVEDLMKDEKEGLEPATKADLRYVKLVLLKMMHHINWLVHMVYCLVLFLGAMVSFRLGYISRWLVYLIVGYVIFTVAFYTYQYRKKTR
jgi:hypothetical protein